MRLKTEDKVVIGASVVASAIAIADYVVSSVKAVVHYGEHDAQAAIYLTLNVSDGGTTIPEGGTYRYDSTGKVILTAVPQLGYVFNGWYVKGALLSSELVYSYNLTESVIISASFIKEDEPILLPSYITPFQKTKAVLSHNFRLWKEAHYDVLGLFEHDIIHFMNDFFVTDNLMFKLCDKNGNGVPDQQIAVYTDNMPDATLYGNLRMVDARNLPPVGPIAFGKYQLGNPLILTTDVNGVVEVLCAYLWEEPVTGIESSHDYINTLGRSGKLKWYALGFGSGWSFPIWDLMRSPTYWYIPPIPIPIPMATGWVEWQLLADPIYKTINAVHVYWVDNPNLFNMGVGSADCNIKMMQSTTNIPYV